MTASYKTVEAVYAAVRKHVTDEQMIKIIDELMEVPGNKSFRETVVRLAAEDAKVSNHAAA